MNYFSPITKQLLKIHHPDIEVAELCGPASITMLLNYCGIAISLDEVIRKMLEGKAFVPGVGTILQKVPVCMNHHLYFLHHAPAFIVSWLLRHGFVGVASISPSKNNNHIVFVTGCDRDGTILYYDSNSSPELHAMSYVLWKKIYNKRIIITKESIILKDSSGL